MLGISASGDDALTYASVSGDATDYVFEASGRRSLSGGGEIVLSRRHKDSPLPEKQLVRRLSRKEMQQPGALLSASVEALAPFLEGPRTQLEGELDRIVAQAPQLRLVTSQPDMPKRKNEIVEAAGERGRPVLTLL